MRILICDDDLELSQQLEKILISFFQKNSLKYPEIVIYNNGTDLLQDFQSKDIVFLDIEMPGMNGIYIGNELKRQNNNAIIFVVTSYSQYLDEAMRFHVFRYLSKPLDKQRIFRNMKDALALYNNSIIKISIETKTVPSLFCLRILFLLKRITIKPSSMYLTMIISVSITSIIG